MTRQGKSLFFPTLYPAARLALEKVNILWAYGISQRSWLFLGWGKSFISEAKREANFSLGMQSHPLPTHVSEVRIHLRTCFWCWSFASTRMSLLSYRSLCVASCPLYWPQTVWTQDASFDLMPWSFLVTSGDISLHLENLHPQDWEPTIPLHTHGGCVVYILYFPLFLYVEA